MPRTPYDNHAKDTLRSTLKPYGKAETDARLTAETQYADLRFVLGKTVGADAYEDFLTRTLAPRMLYEFAHDPPEVWEVASWLHKRDAWFLALRREARRKKVPAPPLPPVLVALSAGDPEASRRAYRLTESASPGVYLGDPSGTFRLVVLSQLPETPDTLRARTMSRGGTLRRALAEFDALPEDSKLRTILGPHVTQLTRVLRTDPSPEAREIAMDAVKFYNKLVEKEFNKGRKEGRKEGHKEGREEELRTAIELVCSTRGLKLAATHRATLAAEHSLTTLRRWHKRAITAARAAEIFSAD